MKLEVAMIVGPETKQWLTDMTKIVERMERAAGGAKGVSKDVEPDEQEAAADEEDDDFGATKKKAAKKDSDFDSDEEEAPKKKAGKKAADFDEEEDEEEEAPKSKKAKKITLDDVNDAARAKCADLGGDKTARDQVKAILKKKFKAPTGSISEIDEKHYPAVIEALAV